MAKTRPLAQKIYQMNTEKTTDQDDAKLPIMRRFSTSTVWYHRSEEMPAEGHRIIVMSPMYADNDPGKIRIIDSQFYEISKDAEWWAYVNCPPNGA